MSKNWKRKGVVAMVLAFSVFAVLVLWLPISPDGRYYNKGIGSGGQAYFEFQNGKVNLMIPLLIRASDGLQTNFVGTYAKDDAGWLLTTTDSVRIRLKANLYSIRWIGPSDEQVENYPRMFFNPK